MIIGSNTKLKIGQVAKGVVDENYERHPDQPFIVIREATFEEWKQEIIDRGISIDKIFDNKYAKLQAEAGYFYEISTD